MLDLLNLLRNFDLIMISFRLFVNLGIGIGTGTDIINASISSSIMSMDRKSDDSWWRDHTTKPRDHVTNKKRYISTFTRPMAPKLSQVVTYGSGDNGACNISSNYNSNSNAELYKWPFFSKTFRYKRSVAISMKLQCEQGEHVKQLFHENLLN